MPHHREPAKLHTQARFHQKDLARDCTECPLCRQSRCRGLSCVTPYWTFIRPKGNASPMAAPYDQLALADDLWMAAHDKPNGGSLLQPKPLGIGLAAALLCELVLTNWIVEVDEAGMLHLHPEAEKYGLPEDVATSGVLSQLLREASVIRGRNHRHSQSSGLPVDDWIQHLQAQDACRLVEERLAGGSHVRQETRGGVFRATR